MLLAIDIGNTNINFGIFKRRKLIQRFFIPTKSYRIKKLKNVLVKYDVTEGIVCSVVPFATKIVARDLKKLLGKQPYIIGKQIKVPLKNLYRKPKQVGQDRLVNAYAAVKFFAAPLIVVDFGTAITFDVVGKNKAYLGGMILPGLEISLEALAQRTALLPKIKLARPREFIGRDTKNSMLSGIVYGLAALTDDFVERIKAQVGENAKVVATGGNVKLIGQYCKRIDKIDRDLTLKGLKMLRDLK